MHNHQFLGFFRNYSEQDINELIILHNDILDNSNKLQISRKLLLCRIENHTLFDLFGDKVDFFE